MCSNTNHHTVHRGAVERRTLTVVDVVVDVDVVVFVVGGRRPMTGDDNLLLYTFAFIEQSGWAGVYRHHRVCGANDV